MDGFFPLFMIAHVVSLSSIILRTVDRFNTKSHRSSAGMPSFDMPSYAEQISASGVEWDTAVCFLAAAANGQKVFGPVNAR